MILSDKEKKELEIVLNNLWAFVRKHSDTPFSIKDDEYGISFTDGKNAVRVELRGK